MRKCHRQFLLDLARNFSTLKEKECQTLSHDEGEQITKSRRFIYIRSTFYCMRGCIKESSLDNANGLTNRSSLLIPSDVILLLTSVNGDVVVTIIL